MATVAVTFSLNHTYESTGDPGFYNVATASKTGWTATRTFTQVAYRDPSGPAFGEFVWWNGAYVDTDSGTCKRSYNGAYGYQDIEDTQIPSTHPYWVYDDEDITVTVVDSVTNDPIAPYPDTSEYTLRLRWAAPRFAYNATLGAWQMIVFVEGFEFDFDGSGPFVLGDQAGDITLTCDRQVEDGGHPAGLYEATVDDSKTGWSCSITVTVEVKGSGTTGCEAAPLDAPT